MVERESGGKNSVSMKRKNEIRSLAARRRRQQPDRERANRCIHDKLIRLPEYSDATTVLLYVSRSFEVDTRRLLDDAWERGKRVVVPCCEDGFLKLYQVESSNELVPRTLGILEPGDTVRRQPTRRIGVETVDLIVTPGVAFDPHGGRVGHGKGYYDKLFAHRSPHTRLVGLAYECQMFAEVPMTVHDVPMHWVVTDEAVYNATVAIEHRSR